MSVESAARFYSNINKNEKIASKLADLNGKEINEKIFNERILPVAKDMGYDFTYAELMEASEQPRELSADALESVSGGGRGGGHADDSRKSKHGIKIDIW